MSGFARRLFDSMMLTLISRLAIIGASALLPALGFVAAFAFNRAVSSFDDLQKKVDLIQETAISNQVDIVAALRLVQLSQDNQTRLLSDHEGRLRRLEQGRIRFSPGPP